MATRTNPADELDINVLREDLGRYEGRLPDPAELVAWGGQPGCEYAQVAVQNIPLAKEQGWQTAAGVPSVTIVGPKGYCEMQVMAKGEPIMGTSPANGVRPWWYDPTLLDETGVLPPAADPKVIETTPSVADLNAKAAEAKRQTTATAGA